MSRAIAVGDLVRWHTKPKPGDKSKIDPFGFINCKVLEILQEDAFLIDAGFFRVAVPASDVQLMTEWHEEVKQIAERSGGK